VSSVRENSGDGNCIGSIYVGIAVIDTVFREKGTCIETLDDDRWLTSLILASSTGESWEDVIQESEPFDVFFTVQKKEVNASIIGHGI
jgi:hypothetical protein